MDAKSTFAEWMSKGSEWVNEQVWFQQLKSKWEELDPQSRTYLQLAGGAMSLLLVLGLMTSSLWSVHKLKRQVADKAQVLAQLQASNDELRRLKDLNSNLAGGGADALDPWPPYFEGLATGAGMPKENVKISEPKTGSSNESAKESLFDLAVKRTNVRQLVRYAQSLEAGSRPVKLRNLTIDTAPDGTGYLDATLSVSAFSLVVQK